MRHPPRRRGTAWHRLTGLGSFQIEECSAAELADDVVWSRGCVSVTLPRAESGQVRRS